MKIFDFNIHLPFNNHLDVNVVINQDLNLTAEGIQAGFNFHKNAIAACEGANFLLFNTRLFNEDVLPFFHSVYGYLKQVTYTALVDFRHDHIFDYINCLHAAGVHAIMFNSYLQCITESDFKQVLQVCEYGSSKGLKICIDGSYGTSKMYTYDNMRLACFIADHIFETPVVIVHAGGYRVIEAMLLAADKRNVWLDTSFSLPYYQGSSIEQDFAYVIKKMDCRRIVFGSDHPYIPFKEALSSYLDFFEKYKFNDVQIEKIIYSNALELFSE
jgi:hypothetical protein